MEHILRKIWMLWHSIFSDIQPVASVKFSNDGGQNFAIGKRFLKSPI
jgi:hypothetical protein